MTLPAAPNKLGITDSIALESAEGVTSGLRIAELEESPIIGKFDVLHLKEIHRYIFQDVYHHAGQFHEINHTRLKKRVPECGDEKYAVYYPAISFAKQSLNDEMAAIFNDLSGSGISHDELADKLTKLYAVIDYAHPFQEGNSRTLREFCSSLARSYGFTLDWGTSNADGKTRDQLYAARDVMVLGRVIHDVQTESQMFGISRTLHSLKDRPKLFSLISQSLSIDIPVSGNRFTRK